MKIPFLDLKATQLAHEGDLLIATQRVIRSGSYVLGQEVEAFEAEFAAYCGASHAVGVANGLDALTLSLSALGIGVGDEVLVPSNTYIATWLAVHQVGATPVPVEPLASTFNIDPALLEAAVTPRTRAVMPVHLYGQPADLDAVSNFAQAHHLAVIADGAQAHGARYRGTKIGAHCDTTGWSFYPGKNLGALGDGGAITTNDAALAAKLRTLRNYGSKVKYHNEVPGWNSRLDELQAAYLRIKLRCLDEDNRHRSLIANGYTEMLSNLPELLLPAVDERTNPVWHLYVVQHPQRQKLAAYLAECGIGSMIHYPIPPHLQPAFAHLGINNGRLPIAERMAEQVLSLPMGPTLTSEQAQTVGEAVARFCSASH